jgi:hypothetical protein
MATTIAGAARSVTVSPGLCVIADQATQSASSPGMYLCAIDSAGETVELESNSGGGAARLDLIYAEVDETAYTVVNKELNGTTDVATLTLSASTPLPSKVKAGETIVVSGVDPTFDGSYVIASKPDSTTITYTRNADTIASDVVSATAQSAGQIVDIINYLVVSNTVTITTTTQSPVFAAQDIVTISGINPVLDGIYQIASSAGATEFTYKRITANVTSTAVSTSSAAQIRIPFAIRSVTGNSPTVAPSLPASTKSIALAHALINTSNVITSVPDARQYVAAPGGIILYNSATVATAPAAAAGRMRFDTATGKLDFYDGTNFKIIYTSAGGFDNTHNHDTRYKRAVTTTTSPLTLANPVSSGSTGTATITATAAADLPSSAISVSITVTAESYVLVMASARLVAGTSSAIVYAGIAATGATTVAIQGSPTATDGTAAYTGDLMHTSFATDAGNSIYANITRLVKVNVGTTVFKIQAYKSGTGTTTVQGHTLRVVPLYTSFTV